MVIEVNGLVFRAPPEHWDDSQWDSEEEFKEDLDPFIPPGHKDKPQAR